MENYSFRWETAAGSWALEDRGNPIFMQMPSIIKSRRRWMVLEVTDRGQLCEIQVWKVCESGSFLCPSSPGSCNGLLKDPHFSKHKNTTELQSQWLLLFAFHGWTLIQILQATDIWPLCPLGSTPSYSMLRGQSRVVAHIWLQRPPFLTWVLPY